MFAGGIGQMNAAHRKKGAPEIGMCVVKIGGPAYRIGIGMFACACVYAFMRVRVDVCVRARSFACMLVRRMRHLYDNKL